MSSPGASNTSRPAASTWVYLGGFQELRGDQLQIKSKFMSLTAVFVAHAPVGLHEVSWFRHSLLADNAHSAVTVVSAYARFSNGLCHCRVTISRWQLLFLPPCPQRRERFHPVGKRPAERNRTHFVKVSVDPGITLLWLSRLKRAANPLSLNKSCLRLFML